MRATPRSSSVSLGGRGVAVCSRRCGIHSRTSCSPRSARVISARRVVPSPVGMSPTKTRRSAVPENDMTREGPAGSENNRPVAAPGPPGDLDVDGDQAHGRSGLVRGGGLLRCDGTGAQPPMISAAIVALDLARCYGAAPAESGKMGLRPLDRFVVPRGAIDPKDAGRT